MAGYSVGGVPVTSGWRARRRAEDRAEFEAADLVERFTAGCWLTGLAAETTSAAGIPGTSAPVVTHVQLGASRYLMVRTRPGQLLGDFSAAAERLAAALGVQRVRCTWRGPGWVRIDLDPADPLASGVELPPGPSEVSGPVMLGVAESGRVLASSLLDSGHLIAQGQTRAGKSRWAYGVLGQVAGTAGVEVCGVDPTGLLLRPWLASRQAGPIASGPNAGALAVLDALAADLDARLAAMPEDDDVLPASEAHPLRLVVLEEWAGIVSRLSKTDGTRVKELLTRLVAEGHKARYRVLLLCQRADATEVGGFARGQFATSVTFRVDSAEAVKMLHQGVGPDVVAAHTAAAPGVALVTMPGLPLARMRSPIVPSYGTYRARVDQTARRLAVAG